MQERELAQFHDGDTRCLHVGGKDSPDYDAVAAQGRKESASDDSRLTYVAMTRAQSQVVAWWAPSWDEPNGGLSRLLRGRRPGETVVPDRVAPDKISDDDAMARFREWEAVGGLVIEESVVRPVPTLPARDADGKLQVRHFHRSIDAAWRRIASSSWDMFWSSMRWRVTTESDCGTSRGGSGILLPTVAASER